MLLKEYMLFPFGEDKGTGDWSLESVYYKQGYSDEVIRVVTGVNPERTRSVLWETVYLKNPTEQIIDKMACRFTGWSDTLNGSNFNDA